MLISVANPGLTLIHFAGPGNFLEVRKILPLLVESSPDHPSFHVVALGIPGYGFSEAPKTKGFKLDQYAEVRALYFSLTFSDPEPYRWGIS
jgi:hypothetical protein